jgi:thiamine kinase-like enzyme
MPPFRPVLSLPTIDSPAQVPYEPLWLDDVVSYIVEKRIVPKNKILDPGLKIEEVSGRCRNFIVKVPRSSSVFIKQAPKDNRNQTRSVASSAKMLRFLEAGIGPKKDRLAPNLISFDPYRSIMVTDAIIPSVSLRKLHLDGGGISFPAWPSRAVGQTLARFHTNAMKKLRRGDMSWLEKRNLDTMETIWRKDPPPGPQARDRFLGTILSDESVRENACTARRKWECAEGAIHGDIRWSNLLFGTSRTGRNGTRLWLVDWEMSCIGDPAWDLACFLSEFLRFWIDATTITSRVSSYTGCLDACRFPFSLTFEAVDAFLSSYMRSAAIPPEDQQDLMSRVETYLPHCILLIGIEAADNRDTVPPKGQVAYEMAKEFLCHPEDRMSQWFGSTWR